MGSQHGERFGVRFQYLSAGKIQSNRQIRMGVSRKFQYLSAGKIQCCVPGKTTKAPAFQYLSAGKIQYWRASFAVTAGIVSIPKRR